LIRKISGANPGWGAPRIVGELHKLGIAVAKSTVDKYRARARKPPSPTWRAFLNNHVKDLVSIDFFTVPTAGFKVLFVLVILAHHRRRVIHFNVTEHPTAHWNTVPTYLLRDRDAIYGKAFQKRLRSLGLEQILSPPEPLAESFCRTTDWQYPT